MCPNTQLLETAIMFQVRLLAIPFAFLPFVCDPLAANGSDPIALRPMRETLLKLTIEQSADIPSAGLSSIIKAVEAADKDLNDFDKRHFAIIRAGAELRMGNSDLAESLLDQALMVNPNDDTALWLRGRCKEATRRFDSAIEDHKKSLELNPDFLAAMLALSGIYVETGDLDEATRWLEKIDLVEEHDDERWEYFVRTVMALKQKNFPDAIKHAEQSLAGGERCLGVPLDKILATKAIAHLALNDMGAAKHAVRQVLVIQPANQQALQMMWTIHNQGGDHLAAYMISKQLNKADAKNDKFLLLQMQSLIRLRQLGAAEQVARRILELNPENIQAKGFVQKLEEVKSRNKAAKDQPQKENPPQEENPPAKATQDQEPKDDAPPADR